MKVPAECPGEQTKEERKRLKVERQAAAALAVEAPTPTTTSNGTSAPTLTRQDTMNSLSSGYATTANRSLSTAPRSVPEPVAAEVGSPLASVPSASSQSSAAPRRNRIVAPPPAAYVSASTNDIVSSPVSVRKRGRMVYPYEARDATEVSIAEGKEFEILEPDGK